jgi:hypothetical protein
MLKKHRGYFILNKNILIAFVASIIVSAIVSNMLSEQADYLNTTYTLLVDYVIYFSTFGGLYYLDNRKKYLLESGQTDKSKLKHDLIKIITSLGIAEVVYTIVRWFSQYYFLTLQYDAYLASIVSQVISTIIYLVVINLSVKMTRLYKDGN